MEPPHAAPLVWSLSLCAMINCSSSIWLPKQPQVTGVDDPTTIIYTTCAVRYCEFGPSSYWNVSTRTQAKVRRAQANRSMRALCSLTGPHVGADCAKKNTT